MMLSRVTGQPSSTFVQLLHAGDSANITRVADSLEKLCKTFSAGSEAGTQLHRYGESNLDIFAILVFCENVHPSTRCVETMSACFAQRRSPPWMWHVSSCPRDVCGHDRVECWQWSCMSGQRFTHVCRFSCLHSCISSSDMVLLRPVI